MSESLKPGTFYSVSNIIVTTTLINQWHFAFVLMSFYLQIDRIVEICAAEFHSDTNHTGMDILEKLD